MFFSIFLVGETEVVVPVPSNDAEKILKEISRFRSSLKASARIQFDRQGAETVLYRIATHYGLDSQEFKMAEIAISFLGARYALGAKSPETGKTDCSGFVYAVLSSVVGREKGQEKFFFESTNMYRCGIGKKIDANSFSSLETGQIISKPDRFGSQGHIALVLFNDKDSKSITVIHASDTAGKVNIKTYDYETFKKLWFEGRSSTILATSCSDAKPVVDYFKDKWGGAKVSLNTSAQKIPSS